MSGRPARLVPAVRVLSRATAVKPGRSRKKYVQPTALTSSALGTAIILWTSMPLGGVPPKASLALHAVNAMASAAGGLSGE